MVETTKFSEFFNAGDLEPNQTTVGLEGGANVRFSNPFPLLPPGTTAERPPIATGMYYRLRFNTSLESYEYYSPTLTDWIQLTDSSPSLVGPIVTYTADPAIPNAQDLGLLTSGILKQTVAAGIATLAIAVPNVDYLLPGAPLGTMAYQDANNVNITGGFAALGAGSVATSPILGTDLVNKAYADSISAGFTFKGSVLVSSTVNLSSTYNNGASGVGATLTALANGVLTMDGVNPPLSTRVLVKDQTSTAENGIYTVTDAGSVSTPFILTRATDFDSAAEIVPGAIVFIQDGNDFSDTSFVQTEPVLTVGTDPILFIQFSQQYPLSMGNGGTGASLTPTVNNLVYSTASNLALLATANNGVLVTSAGGAPSISTTLPVGLTIPGYAHSGANSDITSLLGLTGVIRAPTFIQDVNGAGVLQFLSVASAVDYIAITNQVAGAAPGFIAAGTSPNIDFGFQTLGTGHFQFRSENTTQPFSILSGTGAQHITRFNMANTAATRDVTFPDSSGTLAYLADMGLVLLATYTSSGVASQDIINLTGYTSYLVIFENVTPVTNATTLTLRVSTNNGSSFDSGVNYLYNLIAGVGATITGANSIGANAIILSGGHNSTAGAGAGGSLLIANPGAAVRKNILYNAFFPNSAASVTNYISTSQYVPTTAVNAIRFYFSAGNISTGSWQVYGVR